ncbi:MAG: extracellular solute-binding protein [Phycisphaerae bacterium]|nr:extracellular solute-binding protein [Phycisphaerae bacterium]
MIGGAVIAVIVLWPRAKPLEGDNVKEINCWLPGGEILTYRDAIDEFERRCARKGQMVRIVTGNAAIRDATEDPQRFLTGVAGGMPPDIIYFDRFAIAEWAARGAFLPLDDFLERDIEKLRLLRAGLAKARQIGDAQTAKRIEADLAEFESMMIDPNDFYQNCWNEPTYVDPKTGKRAQFGIPNGTDSRGLYYNCDLLIQAGLVYQPDDPDVRAGNAKAGDARPPKTWEETCLKRCDAKDGEISDRRYLTSTSIDFAAAGIVPGDHACLDPAGAPTLARIAAVEPNRLTLDVISGSPRDGSSLWFKIYDGAGYAIRLTQWDEKGRLRVVGWAPQWGNSWLYMFGWQAGGRFMSADGKTCTLNDPRIQHALQWMVDCYDAMGGFKAVEAFKASTLEGGTLDPFMTGKMAMRIDGDHFTSLIAQYKRDLSFNAAPAPMPRREIDKGRKPISWMGGWAYAIPSTIPDENKDLTWNFIKWMVSWDANRMLQDVERDLRKAQGRLFFPDLHPRKSVCQGFYERYILGQPNLPRKYREAYNVFRGLLDHAYHRPITPVGNRLWCEHRRAMERALNHDSAYPTPKMALDYGTLVVQDELNRVLEPATGAEVNWYWLIGLYVGLVGVTAAGVFVHHNVKYQSKGYWRREWWAGLTCASPWIIGFLTFTAGPILFSILMSFSDYDVINPAHWLGLGNYREAFGDPLFSKSLYNTVFMVISVPLTLIVGLAIALLLDAGVRGLSFYRTIFYLPAIVPAVASSVLWLWVLQPTDGLINSLFDSLGINTLLEWTGLSTALGIGVPVNWLGEAKMAKPALIIMLLWGAGGGMLIWLAGLKSVPEHLYEAASIDGANVWQRFRHVTLPMLSPYVLFNLVMGTIAVFQIFTQAFIMTQGGPNDATLFYAYNLFNQAFRYLRMGYASALAWVLFAIIFLLTLIQMYFSKKWVHYEAP